MQTQLKNKNSKIAEGSRLTKLTPTLAVLLSIILVLIFAISFIVSQNNKRNDQYLKDVGMNPFLSKRIFSEQQNDILINFIPLKRVLNDFVVRSEGKVGVYFEYLPTGVSIGVNDKVEFRLASLSKVPLAMSVLKKVEKGELKMTDIIVLKKENLDSNFGTLWLKGEGAKLSIKELIEICLQESDNTAYETLFGLLSNQDVVDVYENLNVDVIDTDTPHPLVSLESYSSIFRSLYLSSYLRKENSNYLLDILTKTDFKDKIPAGVSSSVKVSHKIGVYEVDSLKNNGRESMYTDCGIVYLPQRPYILCVLSITNEADAQYNIGIISKMIYDYMVLVKGSQ